MLTALPLSAQVQSRPPISPAERALREANEEGYERRPEGEHPGSLLGGMLAVFPGFLVHGTGHFYIGEHTTGLTLLATEVAGIALMASSAMIQKSSPDSANTGALRLGLSHLGLVLFAGSWAADIVGTFKGSEPFEQDDAGISRSGIRLGYGYTQSPLNPFRHHMRLGVDVDTGHLYLRPLIDLEAQLEQRTIELDSGFYLLRGQNAQNGLALGLKGERRENRVGSWARYSGLGYVQWKLDLGFVSPSLRHFYVVNQVGWGRAFYQYSATDENVPALFSIVDDQDTFMTLESGIALNVGLNTRLTTTLLHDPMHPIAATQVLVSGPASPEPEVRQVRRA